MPTFVASGSRSTTGASRAVDDISVGHRAGGVPHPARGQRLGQDDHADGPSRGSTAPDRGASCSMARTSPIPPPSAQHRGRVPELFPHMNVFANVAYPLKVRKVARSEIAERVETTLDLVRLGGFGGRLPHQLSGGQQQRVALARAIVFEPRLLLMDEPLGALDKKLREYMQLEIKHLQRQLRITVIYVTHDQSEALTMSDRIAIMNHGRFEQIGAPDELYRRPVNPLRRRLHRRDLLPSKALRGDGGGRARYRPARRGDGEVPGDRLRPTRREDRAHGPSRGDRPHRRSRGWPQRPQLPRGNRRGGGLPRGSSPPITSASRTARRCS